jgi:hypothetical protein
MKSCFVSTALLLVGLGAAMAHAGPTKSNEDRRAIAAALFQQGITAMQAGKTAEGCDKLAESVATMPDSGAMGALAECDTLLGKISEAWDLWHDLSTSAPTPELRQDATKNAAALDKQLARVSIRFRGAVPSDLVVTLNDKPAGASETVEHRVVPGKLVVVAESADTERWTQTVNTRPGERIEIEIPVVASRGAVRRRASGRVVGLSLAVAGAAAITVGMIYGRSAYSDWSGAMASCGGSTSVCKSAGYEQAQGQLASARHNASIASWTTAAGLAAVAAGVVSYVQFRDPKSAESATAWRASPMVGSQALGISLTGGLP